MPSRSTSWTEPVRPVLGRPSGAAGAEPSLRPVGDAGSASWRADGASTDWCTLRAASVAGVRHRLAGLAPDDSYSWAHGDGVLVVAVADGIGSVAQSAGAAARACRAAAEGGLAGVTDGPERAVLCALDAANRAAEGGGATTLVVAVLARDGAVWAGRVGDSTAFVLPDDGPEVELFDPPDPERTDTVTAALPTGSLEPEVRDLVLDPGAVLVLATDGIADPWRDGPTTVAPTLAALLREWPDPVALLAATDFSRLGCHDDRTILCVSGRSPER